MKKEKTIPPLRPTKTLTYTDRRGVERWTDSDLVVSPDNAFRLGYAEASPVSEFVATAIAAQRSSVAGTKRAKLQKFGEVALMPTMGRKLRKMTQGER